MNPREVYDRVLKKYPCSREELYRIRGLWLDDMVENAVNFYVLNRCSFSGSTFSGGFSLGHPRFTLKQIESILDFRIDCFVEHKCFSESIISCGDQLVFADPPYLIGNTLYGRNGDMHKGFDHARLAEILNGRGNFILCYNDCAEIRKMYKGHEIIPLSWNYGMNKSKQSNEIVIISRVPKEINL